MTTLPEIAIIDWYYSFILLALLQQNPRETAKKVRIGLPKISHRKKGILAKGRFFFFLFHDSIIQERHPKGELNINILVFFFFLSLVLWELANYHIL